MRAHLNTRACLYVYLNCTENSDTESELKMANPLVQLCSQSQK